MKYSIWLVMLSLTACSLTTPRDTGNANQIWLEPIAHNAPCKTPNKAGLIIAYPEVPDTLNTSRIALIDQNKKWDYFAGMRWADFLPGNIQSALVSSFSATEGFSTVSSDDVLTHGRWILESEVRKFEAVYNSHAFPDVEAEIMFTLRAADHQNIRKRFVAVGTAPAEAENAQAIGRAFITAFNDVQQRAVQEVTGCKTHDAH